MRIGIYAKNMFFKYNSGIGKYTTNLVKALSLTYTMDEIHVLVNKCNGLRRLSENVHIHVMPQIKGIVSAYYDLKGAVKMAKSLSLDVLHAPKMILKTGNSVPSVITVHDLYHLKKPERFRKKTLFYWKRLLPLAIRDANGIIVPSKSTYNDLCAFFPDAESKTFIVAHGVSDEYRHAIFIKTIAEKYHITKGYILCVSPINPRKNIDMLVDAYIHAKRKLDTLPELVIVGRYEWGSKAVIKRISSAPNIKHITYVEEKDMPYIYAGATMFIYPSMYEGFGLPVLEAMASGLPIIALKTPAIEELCGDCAFLLHSEPSSKDMADAIIYFYEDSKIRRHLGTKAARIARRYTWKQCAIETHRVYEQIT